jgi:radical SAM superfamily enzyme YgiQ (UPF0313 family)
MNIILINPAASHEQVYGDWDLSPLDTYCPPLGLLHIASFVREHNHTPYVIDMSARKIGIKETVELACTLNPDVVGISAKTINIINANILAQELKKKGLEVPIVLGGSHVTAVPNETLKRFNSIDYGVIGEGEITFLELLERIANCGHVSDVKGLVWRGACGQIITNAPRELIQDLDDLPFPAWDLLPNFPDGYPHSALETKRLPAASIMTSRGCPFQCTFCDHAIFGSVVRHHSAEYTLKMIRHLIKTYGIKDLMILDDNFILNRKRLFQICDTIIDEKMDLSWYCMGHAKFMHEDRLEKIKQAGCWFIEIGIESGCDRILRLLKKNTTTKEVAQAVTRAREIKLEVKGNFIFGLPTETADSLEETIKFATSIPLSYFQLNFLTIWPGCELSNNPQKYGYFTNDWGKLAHQRITFVPHDLTEQVLIRASKRAFRKFYLRPRVIIEMILRLSSLRAIKNVLLGFLIFLKTLARQ